MVSNFPYRVTFFFRACCCLVLISLFARAGNAQDEGVLYDTSDIIVAPPTEFEELYPGFRDHTTEGGRAELREVPDGTVERIKQLKEFAYANDDSLVKQKEERDGSMGFWDAVYLFFTSAGVQVVFYILLVALILYIIYRIIKANNLISFSRRKIRAAEETALSEATEEKNIDALIHKAVSEKDYRNAVRYMYLKGLYCLRDKGWLRLNARATNYDYVQQVSRYPVSSDFSFLTDVYDYVWYGEFPVNDRQFERLQSDFQRFYHAVQP